MNVERELNELVTIANLCNRISQEVGKKIYFEVDPYILRIVTFDEGQCKTKPTLLTEEQLVKFLEDNVEILTRMLGCDTDQSALA